MAIDFYLSVDKAFDPSNKGDVQEQIGTFSVGLSNSSSVSGTGAGAGKVSASNLNLTLVDGDISDTLLQSASANQRHTFYLTGFKAGTGNQAHAQAVEKFVFSEAAVTSFNETFGGQDLPTDQVSIAFRSVKRTYAKQGTNGALTDNPAITWNTANAVSAARVAGPSTPQEAGAGSSAGGAQEASAAFDDVLQNAGAPNATFTFTSGHGNALVVQFRADGADHDTLSFLGTDFGGDIADVLRHTRDVAGGVEITDPASKDTVTLAGVDKGQLVQNQRDIAFHA